MGILNIGLGVSVFQMKDRVASLVRHPSKHLKAVRRAAIWYSRLELSRRNIKWAEALR